MTKHQLTKFVAQATKYDEDRVLIIIDEFIEYIKHCMAQREPVSIPEFGTFRPKLRKARTAHNPRTKEKIEVPEQWGVSFKINNKLKEEINKK